MISTGSAQQTPCCIKPPMWPQSSQTEHICCSKNDLILSVISSVVRFRRTGESTRSEDDVENKEQVIKIAEQTDLEAVAPAKEAPVPREFANPTDGTAFPFCVYYSTLCWWHSA